VRNSGAIAVVEGTGDHGCEDMTGGTVVVLGTTGRNFAAGMSGGIAYVYDPDGDFAKKCNMAMVALDPVLASAEQEAKVERAIWHSTVRNGEGHTDEAILKGLIERHFKYTGSTRARNLLDNWSDARSKFVKVFPTEYKRALGELNAAKASKEKVAA
jgi:glutamate synthase (NADPH/NADH) large chain